jgi:hypothetical protein
MIDFIDSQMKAEVTNLLGGKSEMITLSDDSLILRLSDASTVQMFLLKTEESVDSCNQVICMIQTFGTDSLCLDTKFDFFTSQWRKLDERPKLSDADEYRITALDTKTILNFMDAILKKD